MDKLIEAKRWFELAERDFKSAQNNFNNADYYVASLLCQQSVEKGLKALYLKKFKEIRKIHNLVILAKDLKLPKKLIDKCDKLNPIYIETRYPDASGELPHKKYTEDKSKEDIKEAGEILKWLKKKILKKN